MRSTEEDRTGYRTIQGRGEATPASGTGFNMRRSNTGQYDITFDKSFRGPPIVISAVEHSAAYFTHVGGVSKDGCTIYVENDAGARQNASIDFLIRGPA